MRRRKGIRLALVGAAVAVLAAVGFVISPFASAGTGTEVPSRVEGSRCWQHNYEATAQRLDGSTVRGRGMTGWCGDGVRVTENHRIYCSNGSGVSGCTARLVAFSGSSFTIEATWKYCANGSSGVCLQKTLKRSFTYQANDRFA